MKFDSFWNNKVQKKHRSWAARAKRYAEQHIGLEEIRKEVYLPLDFNANFNLNDLVPLHFAGHNPLIKWKKGEFSFSEEGLRSALEGQGADIWSFRMDVTRESIKGKDAPLPENSYGLNEWEDYRYGKPNKVYNFDQTRFNWIRRMYDICTDLDTVRLAYRQVTMTIHRYSNANRPFGYYEINPCELDTLAMVKVWEKLKETL